MSDTTLNIPRLLKSLRKLELADIFFLSEVIEIDNGEVGGSNTAEAAVNLKKRAEIHGKLKILQKELIGQYPHVWNDFLPDSLVRKQKELLTIANEVNIDYRNIKHFYMLSLPQGQGPDQKSEDLKGCLNHLWDIPIQQRQEYKSLPVFEFIERIARNTTDKKKSDELKRKINEIINEHYQELTENDISVMQKEIADQEIDGKQNLLYLLVEIHPSKKDSDQYRIYFSFWQDQENIKYYEIEDQTYTINDISEKVSEVLNMITKKYKYGMTELTIEFFLPLELMHCEVDQWSKSHSLLSLVNIGIDYKVIVRSLERANDMGLHGYWKEKWDKAQSISSKPVNHNIFGISDLNQYSAQRLYKELIHSKEVCLGFLTFLPSICNDKRSVLSEIISAGIPIILWSRLCHDECKKPLEVNRKFKALFENNRVCQIPDQIRSERRQAKHPTDIGNHITLLWDDPNRLPGHFNPECATPLEELKIEGG